MQVDVLIIGQGICGTLLSWFLHQEGKSFLVMDEAIEDTASRAAGGIINPVTGRRYVHSWMIDTVLPFAGEVYTAMGKALEVSFVQAKSIIDFFPSAQMRNAFVERLSENDTYLHAFPEQDLFNPFFRYDFGSGKISPACAVYLQPLLNAWQKKLQQLSAIRHERFTCQNLVLQDGGVRYGDITAQKIIFCDGIAAAANPWFSRLPFSANKGEALLLTCPGLPREHIFKQGMLLVPLPEENLFWFGSNYQWEFNDAAPSTQFYQNARGLLQHWLKLPFSVEAHKAAVRPATLERRPFAGFHPHFPAVGILNGMGSKGISLAPFFAHQLVQHLVWDLPLTPEADVRRFSRILSQ